MTDDMIADCLRRHGVTVEKLVLLVDDLRAEVFAMGEQIGALGRERDDLRAKWQAATSKRIAAENLATERMRERDEAHAGNERLRLLANGARVLIKRHRDTRGSSDLLPGKGDPE